MWGEIDATYHTKIMTDPKKCPNCGGELSVTFDKDLDDYVEYCGNCPYEAPVEHDDKEAE